MHPNNGSHSRPKIRENSFAFPSIATLNIFRKKLPPHQSLSPVEPCGVGSGIWIIDATARIFGYLNANDKSEKFRIQSAKTEIQAANWQARPKPLPTRNSLGGCKQAHFVKRTEQCSTDKEQDESEAPSQLRQKGRGKEEIRSRSNWFGIRQRTMRTVSRDDQLVERGANPRTGLASPFAVSDNSEEWLGVDEIAVAKITSAGPSPKRETCSGKWKQDSLGWSLVESPTLESHCPEYERQDESDDCYKAVGGSIAE